MILDEGIFPKLQKLMISANDEIKQEAAWAISNAVSGANTRQMEYFINIGICTSLGNLLVNSSNPKIRNVCVEALNNIVSIVNNIKQNKI